MDNTSVELHNLEDEPLEDDDLNGQYDNDIYDDGLDLLPETKGQMTLCMERVKRNKRVVLVAVGVILVAVVVIAMIAMISGDDSSSDSSSSSGMQGSDSSSHSDQSSSSSQDDSSASSSSSSSSSSSGDGGPYTGWRLPGTVIPSHYLIELNPDFDAFTFSGSSTVNVSISEASTVVVIHAIELEIFTATFYQNGVSTRASRIAYNTEYEFAYLYFDTPISGAGSLRFTFKGILNNQMRGFYRSSFVSEVDNETKWIASTQFESTDARRAFPCFDEPNYKATFDISLIASVDLVALSNAPEKSSVPLDGGKQKRVTFDTTPMMSTYLVAFIIGPFTQVEAPYSNGASPLHKVRVFAPTGLQEQGVFALTVAKQVMTWYENTLQQNFPIAKLDLIAIPDFAAGAMENWGLVTYRQTALLINQAEASASNYQRVAIVVAHELAHQWFGDLVTTGWWSSLWLNEGFATFFEVASLAALPDYDEWALWDQFLVDQQQPGFSTDALASSHPMDNPSVLSPDSISEMFDDISYAKSGSVIRMIQHWLGDAAFYAGLRSYQATYKYGNTQSTDLFRAWAAAATSTPDAANTLVAQFLSWSTQIGFPVVSVTRANSNSLDLSQQPFTLAKDRQWPIPLMVRTVSGVPAPSSSPSLTLMTTSQQRINSVPGNVLVNSGQTGFFRVHYDQTSLNALATALLQHPEYFNVSERAGLTNDQLVLARFGYQKTSVALAFIDFLANEHDYTVWESALGQLSYMDSLMVDMDCYASFRGMMQGLLSNVVAYIGWGDEPNAPVSHPDQLLREAILSAAVHYRIPSVLAESVTRFWAFIDGAELAPDLRLPVYRAALAEGGEEAYDALTKHWKEDSVGAAEEQRIMRALGSTRERHLLERTLRMSIQPEWVRPQDRRTVLAGVASNPLGRELAWAFFRANFDQFNERGFSIGGAIKVVTSHFSSTFRENEVKEFFEKNPASGGETAVSQSLETIANNRQWLETNAEDVCTYLLSL